MTKIVVLPTRWADLENYLGSKFLALATQDSFRYHLRDSWLTGAKVLVPPDCGTTCSSRWSMESLVEVEEGTLVAYLRLCRGAFSAYVASGVPGRAEYYVSNLRERYPTDEVAWGSTIPMVFWSTSPHGPNQWRRSIEVPSWAEVAGNYSEPTREQLDAMMAWRQPGGGGQLVLWHGVPGTGKTWAIRAMASEWREWCQFEYVTDPDELFKDAAYLTNVLLRDEDFEDDHDDHDDNDAGAESSTMKKRKKSSWRCFILEDTGEMLTADAKTRQGQGLSRLLNVVDGLLGQGLRILMLITTNEEIKELHSAVMRPGRCLYQVQFDPLTTTEALTWFGKNGLERAMPVHGTTLAQLYHRLNEFPLRQTEKKLVGFVK